MSVKNSEDKLTPVGLILFFLKGAKKYFALSVLFAVLLVLFELVNPKIIGYTVDFIVDDYESMPVWVTGFIESLGGRAALLSALWKISLIVIAVSVFGALFRYLFRLFNSMGAESLSRRMRDTLYHHIIRLPFSWQDKNRTGDIIQRCTSDVDMIKNFISEQLTNLVRMAVMIVLALTFMSRISVKLTLVAALFFPIVILYSCLFHNKIGESFEKVDSEEGRVSAIVQENLTGVRVVRAFGRESFERERFETKNEYYTGLWVYMMKVLSKFWTVNDFISGIQMLSVLSFGSYLAVKGQLTAGDFVAFISYNGLLTWPVRELGRVISDLSKAGVSIDRLLYIMNSEEETDREGAADFPEDRTISFENVSFSYTDAETGEKYVLSDVSFTIKPGETVGILGGTGSGKTTLLQLLDHLYEINGDSGRITIGGINIRDIKRSELRKNIGYVLQEPYLFSRSLEENIKVACEDADEEALAAAVSKASLTETIKKFKEGFNTMVGERGVTLSGGQKQRTAIAQMLIRKPKIMVFDDSLSAVDSQTDIKIRKGIKEASKDSTLILVSHRITTIMNADKIVVLENGRIAELGTHEELKNAGGDYSRICALQTSGLNYEGGDSVG